MKKRYALKNAIVSSRRKVASVSAFVGLCLFAGNANAQTTLYYLGNSSDIPHYKVVSNSNGSGSITAVSSAIKLTSTNATDYYFAVQRMNDPARNYINASDLFPTDDSSGTITFKIVDQPSIGVLSVRLGLYSVNDDCSIISMPVGYLGEDAEQSTQFASSHQADGTTYIVNLASNPMRTQFNKAFAIAALQRGNNIERPEGFVLKFGWASYSGAQSSITIDDIRYTAPTNMPVTPASCFNLPGILPLTLSSFTAKPVNGSVQLQWMTTMEKNVSSFAIERSTDGRNYSSIGTLAATGNSTLSKNYSFNDLNPTTGTLWYRLRITDKDGSVKYSEVKMVFFHKDPRQTVLVKTGTSLQSLDMSGWDLQQPAMLTITDAAGRIIRTTKVALDSRVINIAESVPTGVYMIKLQQNSKQAVARLVF